MELTIFLAKVIGWYFVIMAIFLIVRRDTMRTVTMDIWSDKGLMLFIVTITLIIGLLLVISHNLWVVGWPVIITIISWLVLLSGLMRLFLPEHIAKVWQKCLRNTAYLIIPAVIYFIVGLYLLYKGYYR